MVSGVSIPEGSDEAIPDVRPETIPDMTPVAMPEAMPSATSWSARAEKERRDKKGGIQERENIEQGQKEQHS